MKILNNKLDMDLNIRTEMDFPIKGIEFIDINPLILQSDVFKRITDFFVEEVKNKNVDYIVAPEARGFLFGASVADRINVGLIPVRKVGKLPPTTVEAQLTYEKEYGEDILELPKLVNDNYNKKRFYIIDDIYATGNTMNVIVDKIKELGGIVTGIGTVINIVELNDNKDIFSIIDVNEE